MRIYNVRIYYIYGVLSESEGYETSDSLDYAKFCGLKNILQ